MAQQAAFRAWFNRWRAGRTAISQQGKAWGPEQEAYVLARAYVPEHIPALMAGISGATPALVADHLCFAADDWLIFVGYPLDGRFAVERCAAALAQARTTVQPQVVWFIGPEIPPGLAATCRDRQSDIYYRLDLPATVPSGLRRALRSAAARLTVRVGRAFTSEHQALTDELLARAPLPPLVAGLYRAMPQYVTHSASAAVLEARTAAGALAAFYVVEGAVAAFDAYVLGAYSRQNYVPYASDLLFAAMIERAQAAGKPVLNLGLGVNDGIRRFKAKWGGAPSLAYEACAWRAGTGSALIDALVEWKP